MQLKISLNGMENQNSRPKPNSQQPKQENKEKKQDYSLLIMNNPMFYSIARKETQFKWRRKISKLFLFIF